MFYIIYLYIYIYIYKHRYIIYIYLGQKNTLASGNACDENNLPPGGSEKKYF